MSVLTQTDWKLYLAQSTNPLLLQDERIAIMRMWSEVLSSDLYDIVRFIRLMERMRTFDRTRERVLSLVLYLTATSANQLRFAFVGTSNNGVFYYHPDIAEKVPLIRRYFNIFKLYGTPLKIEPETSATL